MSPLICLSQRFPSWGTWEISRGIKFALVHDCLLKCHNMPSDNVQSGAWVFCLRVMLGTASLRISWALFCDRSEKVIFNTSRRRKRSFKCTLPCYDANDSYYFLPLSHKSYLILLTSFLAKNINIWHTIRSTWKEGKQEKDSNQKNHFKKKK